jgi:hypothetical protein
LRADGEGRISRAGGEFQDKRSQLRIGTTVSALGGYVAPGATGVFKVTMVLTTRNEKGSNVVMITRPDVYERCVARQ